MNSKKNIVVITSNQYIGLCVNRELPDNEIKIIGKCRYISSIVKKYVVSVLALATFVKSMLKKMYYVRSYGLNCAAQKLDINSKMPLVKVYVNASKLSENGMLNDSHYGNLLECLRNHECEFVCEPNLSSLKKPKLFYKWLIEKSKGKFWLPEAKLKIYDLLKAIYITVCHFIFYHKLGLRVVLESKSFYLDVVAQNYIKALSPLLLQRSGLYPGLVIFNWENKGYEKYMVTLYREYHPNVEIKGYMNTFPCPLYPEMCAHEKELRMTPLPDQLVCMSEYVYNVMRSHGYPEEILKHGVSFRDSYMFLDDQKSIEDNVDDKDCRNRLLVSLSMDENRSKELISLLVEFASMQHNYEIIIRPHPYTNKNIIDRIEKYNDIFSISYGAISDDFRRTGYFIYSGPTNTTCEALALGKVLLKYNSRNYLNMDCLYYNNDCDIQNFKSADELFLRLNDCSYSIKKKKTFELVEYLFKKATLGEMKKFIGVAERRT